MVPAPGPDVIGQPLGEFRAVRAVPVCAELQGRNGRYQAYLSEVM
jgi:hypothetical protein